LVDELYMPPVEEGLGHGYDLGADNAPAVAKAGLGAKRGAERE
jgi:hypothetical protein